jgi:hypothetical protein
MHPMSVHLISSNTLNDLKAHIDSNTVVVRDFNTPLAPIERSSKQRNPRNKRHHRANGPN